MKLTGFITRSLRNKLLFIILLAALVPALGAAIYGYQTAATMITSQLQEKLIGYSHRIALSIEMYMSNRVDNVISWSNLDLYKTAVETGNHIEAANSRLFTTAKVYNFSLITLSNEAGQCIASNAPGVIGQRANGADWFNTAMKGEQYVGDFAVYPLVQKVAPKSGGFSLLIAMPIKVDGQVRGVVAGYLDWEAVNALNDSFGSVGKTGYTYVENYDSGALIIYPFRTLLGVKAQGSVVNLPQLYETLKNNSQGVTSYEYSNKQTHITAVRMVGYERIGAYQNFSKHNWTVASGANYTEEMAPLQKEKIAYAIFFGVLTFVVVGLVILVGGMIAKPLVKTATEMGEIARELDFTRSVEVKGQDEVAALQRSFNGLIAKLQETFGTIIKGNREVSESVAQVKDISANIANNATEQSRRAGDVLARVVTMGQTAEEVQKNAAETKSSFGEAAALVEQFAATSQRIAKAAQSQSEMVGKAEQIIGQMGETAQQVAARAALQAEAAQKTASSAAQMSTAIGSVVEKTSEADRESELSHKAAVQGRAAVEKVAASMHNIAESSEQITEIIEVISDIAAQTNQLPLNAAIVAARAGEHGRGFAVVAEEVRKLAERTAESTKEISVLIKGSADRVKEGSDLANSSREAIGAIVDAVAKTNTLIHDISQTTSEQRAVTDSVAKAMDSLRALSGEIMEMTSEQGKRREYAGSIINEVSQLSRDVSGSTLEQAKDSDKVISEMQKMNAHAENITNMTGKQRERAQELLRIIQEMESVATTNAKGAQNSHQFSINLIGTMEHFSALVEQFKVDEDGSVNGNRVVANAPKGAESSSASRENRPRA
ncbi:MAG: methyl-accepting chemotaxis protein [Syntrophobacteraceae bacterium]|nr:methyl-accepting chemotaxis protein [Syntrophobacteraceae bacterium]